MNPRYLKIPLLLLALTPLVFYEGALFPFIFSKTLYIRTLLTLLWVGLAIYLIADLYRSLRIHTGIRENSRPAIRVNQKTISVNQSSISVNQRSPISINQRSAISENPRLSNISVNQRLWKNPIFLSVTAFFIIIAVGTIFAENPYRAFWGDVERGEGLVGLLFFFGFFVSALFLFKAIDWKRFFILTLVPAVALFADQLFILFARQSFFIQIHEADFAAGRALGSLVGNPTFLSTFYLFAIFAALMLLAEHRGTTRNNAPARLLAGNYAEVLSRVGLIAIILISTAGIFIGQTRGAILGLVIGIVAVLLYFAFYQHKSANISINQQSISINQRSAIRVHQRLRRVAIAGLLFLTMFGAIFIATRHLPIWQEIPGISRIAAITWEDPTLQTRLISAGIGLNAISPANEGIIRTLFGWGQENFISAYSEHYDPRFFRYEHTWFDRAHNKLVDVLVMNGILGLMAYLMLWGFVFYFILKPPKTRIHTDTEQIYTDKDKESAFNNPYKSVEIGINQRHQQNPYQSAALLFFATAYFVQNLFAFENVSTYIPFFAFLAFVASLSTQIHADTKQIYADKESALIRNNLYQSVLSRFLPAAVVFAAALFFAAMFAVTFTTFLQSIIWTRSFAAKEPETVLAAFNFWSSPYTFGQTEIRRFAITAAMGIPDLSHPAMAEIYLRSLRLAEESALREATNPQSFIPVAAGHELIGNLEMAEKHRLKIVELAPRRQDALYSLAWVYVRQGRNEEAMALAEQMLRLDPYSPRSKIYYAVIAGTTASKSFDEVTSLVFRAIDGPVRFSPLGQDIAMMRNLFQFYIAAFYRQRNEERFLEAMERARLFEERYDSGRAAEIQQGIDAFRQFGWDAIALEE